MDLAEYYEHLAVEEGHMEDPTSFDIQEDTFVENNNHKDFDTVVRQYDITKIGWGYIIMFLLGPLFISALYSAMVGMIMRIYMAVILYVISPPIVAMYVLDEGSAYKNWRQRFIGTVLSGYGTVVAFNLYMMLAEVVSGSEILKFFESDFLNRAVELIFLLVGAMMLKNISKTISGIIGADDAMEQGEGIGKQITDKAKKIGKTAIGVGTGAATLAVGGAAMIGAKGAGFAAKIASKSGAMRAGKLQAANDGLSEKLAKNKNKVNDMRDKRADKKFGKSYSELTDKEKKAVDKSFARNKTYHGLLDDIKSDEDQISANNAEIVKEQQRGRSLHVAAARAGQLGKANMTGMFANSTLGKSFNQITGNAIKATGGKGVDQWDGEITSKSDLEKDIFQEYNKAKQAKQEEKYNSRLDGGKLLNNKLLTKALGDDYAKGGIGSNFNAEIATPQVRQMAMDSYQNIMTAKEESGAKEQQSRLDMQQFMDAMARVLSAKGSISESEFEKGFQMARDYAALTGDNRMLDGMNRIAALNANVQNGHISASDAATEARKIETDMNLNQKVDTKVEAEIKRSGAEIEKLNAAIKAGNKKAMDEALRSFQEKLGKEGIEVKNIEQITKEIKELATTEKANEKKLSKLMSQIGKLTGGK